MSDGAGEPRREALPAVILAGGLGSRLGALTAAKPKSLVEVAGRPVLDWILRWLAETGVREVVLLVGYLGDQIVAFVGDGHRWGLRARCSAERTPLGTGGALAQALDALPASFLLLYGDSYLPIDYAGLSQAFEVSGADAMMAVYQDVDGVTGVRPNVRLDGPRVLEYAKGVRTRQTHIDAGAVAMKRHILDRLPAGPSALEVDLYPALAREGRLFAHPTSQRFYDAGTPARLQDLERALTS